MTGQILIQRVLTIRRVREITAIMDQLFVAPFFKVHRHTCNHVFEAGGRIAEKETLLSFKSELLTVYGCRSNHFFLLSGVSLTATVGSSQRRSRAVSTRWKSCAVTNVVERPPLSFDGVPTQRAA